jgi:deazaflavin-dependent oxidoreductase (nitroreductase family)
MTLDEPIERALTKDHVIDITTIGRKTKKKRRIEIWFHNVDGRIFISGLPGRRSWYANLLANPRFTFHLKRSVQADLLATAKPVVDQTERRKIISKILGKDGSQRDLDAWMKGSPLVEVLFDAPQNAGR